MISDRIARLRRNLAEKVETSTLTLGDVEMTLEILGSLAADAAAMENHGGPIPRLVASTIDDATIAQAGGKIVRLRPRAGERA